MNKFMRVCLHCKEEFYSGKRSDAIENNYCPGCLSEIVKGLDAKVYLSQKELNIVICALLDYYEKYKIPETKPVLKQLREKTRLYQATIKKQKN